MINTKLQFSLIGAGRVGLTFLKALIEEGYQVSDIIDKNWVKLKKQVTFVPPKTWKQDFQDLSSVDFIILAVPDDELCPVVLELERIFRQEKKANFIFHTSGLLTSEVLMPLQKQGVTIASCHPVQTFTSKATDSNKLRNIYFVVEGEIAGIKIIQEICKPLNNKVIVISREQKPSHHLACTIASNYLNVLIFTAAEILQSAGLTSEEPLEMLIPLASTTLDNIKNLGLGEALSGPVVRGDVDTVNKHIQYLTEKFPFFSNLYQDLGKILLTYPSIKKTLSPEKYQLFSALFKNKQGTK